MSQLTDTDQLTPTLIWKSLITNFYNFTLKTLNVNYKELEYE